MTASAKKVYELALYSKNTYIEGPIVTKKALFLIETWNQFEAASEGVARATNWVEGWHCGLQAYITGFQLNVWMLLRKVEKNSKMQKVEYIQETTGCVCYKSPRHEQIKQ